MSKKPTTIELYFVWVPDGEFAQAEAGSGNGYFNSYTDLDDAVGSSSDPVEIWKAELKPLGVFRSKKVIEKIKKAKSPQLKGV